MNGKQAKKIRRRLREIKEKHKSGYVRAEYGTIMATGYREAYKMEKEAHKNA